MNARYALRSNADTEAGVVWSVGGFWSSNVPAEGELMTGPQVDEFAARHPDAQVIDVIVYRAACAVWNKAFNASIAALGDRRSTHDERQAARAAGDAAVKAAGYQLS
ncbi:MAG: hypothetical protein AB9M53_00700 [Leptothrix sp. (in: b-proteobacteria)]